MFTTDEHLRMLAALRTDLNRAVAQIEAQNSELQSDGLAAAQADLAEAVRELNGLVRQLNEKLRATP